MILELLVYSFQPQKRACACQSFAYILKIIPTIDPKISELNLYCSKHNYFTTYSFPRQHVVLLPLLTVIPSASNFWVPNYSSDNNSP